MKIVEMITDGKIRRALKFIAKGYPVNKDLHHIIQAYKDEELPPFRGANREHRAYVVSQANESIQITLRNVDENGDPIPEHSVLKVDGMDYGVRLDSVIDAILSYARANPDLVKKRQVKGLKNIRIGE